MGNGHTRCKSGDACMRRLRSGKHLTQPVRLELEHTAPNPVDNLEQQRTQRQLEATRYRDGLCIDCGALRHSPGRPRCDRCHAKLTEYRVLGYG